MNFASYFSAVIQGATIAVILWDLTLSVLLQLEGEKVP